ncbi:SRPBCC domain-containing protein [Planomicrobium sp. CPCC 101079]|uniref:SRPBCC domain-containing protein n=1 Tax=Planomicrobium sp. CPCC 101079 TaxID=2599618 RepID=UPI0011B856F2|nr:SRPBCC domain-containing protein [Planomicrobium sp. CPCC 101079]TWT01429.1 SRPBCC domain-containing protein [Planomicrobium sp. CPCC 101079]
MTANNESNNATVTRVEGREMIMERFFMASRELVFSMYTERDHIVNWWGPVGWTTTVYQMDVRPGGVWHYCMRSDNDGQEAWGKSVYEEVAKPERLVFTDAFSDENGAVLEDMPVMKITTDFIEEGNGTKIISRTLFASEEELQKVVEMGVVEGMSETFDRLETYLNEF